MRFDDIIAANWTVGEEDNAEYREVNAYANTVAGPSLHLWQTAMRRAGELLLGGPS